LLVQICETLCQLFQLLQELLIFKSGQHILFNRTVALISHLDWLWLSFVGQCVLRHLVRTHLPDCCRRSARSWRIASYASSSRRDSTHIWEKSVIILPKVSQFHQKCHNFTKSVIISLKVSQFYQKCHSFIKIVSVINKSVTIL